MRTHQEGAPLDGWPSITLPVVLKYQATPDHPANPPPPCRPSHLPLPLSRVGIKSATHQPSGYLKSLSVDRLRYRRCFVRELVAFVARLHDPSLVVKYLRGKREKKWREVCITDRAWKKGRSVISEYYMNNILLDFLDSKKKEICNAWFLFIKKKLDKLCDVCYYF